MRYLVTSLSLLLSTIAWAARPGMGAIPVADGVLFRVWAPNAEKVSVVGDFNGWDVNASPLAAEGNGSFSAEIRGARVGQQYKYAITWHGALLYRADPRAQAVTGPHDDAVIVDQSAYHWKTSQFHPAPRELQVLYEMHIGTFGTEPGRALGTWRGATAKLDHLKKLGVNMLEIMPPADFQGEKSWGYNPKYPYAPARAYGTPDDMKAFIDSAHEQGIGIVLDVVHNHYGPGGDLWQFDGESYGYGGIYFYDDWKGKTPWGSRPNYGRVEVRDYIYDNTMMWLRDYRADGLRWDATSNIHHAGDASLPDGWDLLRRVTRAVREQLPEKILIAEDLKRDAAITADVSQGGAGFHAQWDPGFFWPLLDPIIQPDDNLRHLESVRSAILHQYNGDARGRVIYTENHDEVGNLNGKVRLPNKIDARDPESYFARKRAQVAVAIMMTSPGVPMLFQGQEILETGTWGDRMMDWSRAVRFAPNLKLYQDLVALRTNRSGHTGGLAGGNTNVFHMDRTAKIMAYHRWGFGGPGDDVVVLVNLSARPVKNYSMGFPRGGMWHARFNGDWRGYGGDYGDTYAGDVEARHGAMDGLAFTGSLDLGAYSAVILSQ